MLKDHSIELRDELLSKRPATPLPWHSEAPMGGIRTSGYHLYTAHTSAVQNTRREDSQYIVHAANSYPRLVEALRRLLNGEFGNVSLKKMQERGGGSYWTTAATLLRDLGESE